jgi:hypothetical protein
MRSPKEILKEYLNILASVWKKEEDSDKWVYRPGEYKDAELPKEFRVNLPFAMGCLVFVLLIILINILIFVFFRVGAS